MEAEDEVWCGISDEDLLAIDLDMAGQQAEATSSQSPASKRTCSEMLKSSDGCNGESNEGTRKHKEPSSPLSRLRGGYLWVSDLSKQLWCEQQLEYKLSLPPDLVRPEPEQVTKGSNLHLARELQIQDYVNVEVTSSEDIFAIKILNLLIVMRSILTQTATVHREVPIFGVINGVFIIGKIDEVRVDRETFNIDIMDLKTRKNKRPPGASQKATHNIQVMVYKKLFDDLVRGLLPLHSLTTTLKLNLTKSLGESVAAQVSTQWLTSEDYTQSSDKTWNISQLLDKLKKTAESLPFISQLLIDYVWQEDQQTFLIEEVKYDGEWLDQRMTECLSYWLGRRDCRGVDIEDAWKCHSCDYQDSCKWLAQKTEELQQAQQLKYKKC